MCYDEERVVGWYVERGGEKRGKIVTGLLWVL